MPIATKGAMWTKNAMETKGAKGDQWVPEKPIITMVPILKTKVAKNNVEVNKTKEVKNWFGALGRQDHQWSPRMPSWKEPGQGTTEPRRLKAKGQGSHDLLIFITYPILKVINVWMSITQNRL